MLKLSLRKSYRSQEISILRVFDSFDLYEIVVSFSIAFCILVSSADPEGGPGVRTPPLRFVRGGVLCRGLISTCRRGVQRSFSTYYYLFFLARFARQYYTNVLHIYILPSSNIQYGTAILSLYFPYPNYEKNPTSHPLLHETAFLSRIA